MLPTTMNRHHEALIPRTSANENNDDFDKSAGPSILRIFC
jgi:hypothetical protein